MVTLEDRLEPMGPGKTAPRLINDLLDYDPRFPQSQKRNSLADPAPHFRGVPLPGKHRLSCHHSLYRKETTRAPLSRDERPDTTTNYVVAAICGKCRYHFEISVEFWPEGNAQSPCHLSDPANPLHHLRRIISKNAEELRSDYDGDGVNKYNELIEAHRFKCSASQCPAVVEIKISLPRLSDKLLVNITDQQKVFIRSQKAIEADPARFHAENPLQVGQTLGYLRQYLKDAESDSATSGRKRIAQRNKRYVLAFADECEDIFEHLDFVKLEETDPDTEEKNYFWQLPIFTERNRDFLADVILELTILIFEQPKSELKSLPALPVFQPLPALKDVERSLGCWEYPTRSRNVDLSKDEHPYYASLGAVENFTDELLSWAYDRQCECDPSNKPYYLDCLEDLATGRNSENLQTKYAMAVSGGEVGQKVIEDAYRFFGLKPQTAEGDQHIMGVYSSRLVSAPRQKEEAKNCLLIIAKHRNSPEIEALAHNTTMTLEEALALLNVKPDTGSDSIDAAAVAAELDEDTGKIIQALEIIAKARNNDMVLLRAAQRFKSGMKGGSLSVSDAYARLQISSPDNTPDTTIFTYYQSLMDQAGSATGSKESYKEALRVIAINRESNLLLKKLEDPNAVVLATSAEPVGLENIGNTCYLNSLLQFYYTVKPVRDMVMDFQNHRMSLSDVEIKKKRVGGREVNKSEVIKAQKFVEELHNLFENLKTASSRHIKPTRQLAELTLFSSQMEAEYRRHSISSPSGPPDLAMILDQPVYGPQWPPPAEAVQPAENKIEDDIEMIDNPIDRDMDIGDDTSDSTLVNDIDTPMEKATNEKTEPEVKVDEVMADIPTEPKTLSTEAPEKPPPIPPRNKAGLVIHTNDKKETVSDDDLWRFGTQQDVTEVIGNVMFRLQCAIKPTSIEDGSGIQIDIIRDTFYGATTTYTHKAEGLEPKTEPWAHLIVYPGKVPRDIYEALDVVFDEQIVDLNNAKIPQYSSINRLPPVLQIQIQRTDFDATSNHSSKNRTPVIFPETIYLDRYVESGDQDSNVMRRRRETWKWKEQLRILESRQAALKNTEAEITVPDALNATKEFVNVLQEEDIPGLEIDPALPEALEERLAEVAMELNDITDQIANLKQRLAGQFTDMHKYEYKLHSVFIHRGETGGGHYWIYIYDFENDIWREYNDEHVSEVKDRRKIFEHQGSLSGTPYYLVYVRSADRKDLVDAVCRDVQEVPEVEMTGVTDWLSHDDDGDLTMMDDTNGIDESLGDVRHVEHVKPRPLRPKPVLNGDSGTNWVNDPWGKAGVDSAESAWENGGAGGGYDANGKPW